MPTPATRSLHDAPSLLGPIGDRGSWLVVAIAAVATGVVVGSVRSTGFYWHDDYQHLIISRLALQDPRWLLHVWGRPLMTLAYIPASVAGEWLARTTSLAFLFSTAALCALIARRRSAPLPLAAALFLMAQPLAARLGYSALPGTVFSFVLASAFWLRSVQRPAAAAWVASLLPLARVEGVVVVAVWALVMIQQRAFRNCLRLAAGTVAWALAAALVSGDALWLWHHNPYGLLGSAYPAAGWGYLFVALPLAVGPVIAGLALTSFLRSSSLDPLVGLSGIALAAFYAFAWGMPAFGSFRNPVYLVSISVPIALAAHACLVEALTLRTDARRWGAAVAIAAAVASIVLGGAVSVVGLALALTVIVALIQQRVRPMSRVSGALTQIVCVGAAAAALWMTRPLALDPIAVLSRAAATELGERCASVVFWGDPAFGWFAGRLPDAQWGQPPPLSWGDLSTVRPGGLVVWDSQFGPNELATTEDDLRRRGFRPVWLATEGWARVSVWARD